MDLNKENYKKIGRWENSTYFNLLSLEAQSKYQFRKILGIDYDFGDFVGIDNTYFRSKKSYEELLKLFSYDPLESIRNWNNECTNKIQELRGYIQVINYSAEISDINKLEIAQQLIQDMLVFLWSYLEISDVAEKYFVEKFPDLKLEDVSPSQYLSSELIHRDVSKAKSKEDLEKVRKKWEWYTINLLEGEKLSIDYLEGLKKRPYEAREIKMVKLKEVQLLQELMWLKFQRIDIINFAFYSIEPLVERLLRLSGINSEYWKVLSPQELMLAIKESALPVDIDSRFDKKLVIKDGDTIRHGSSEEFDALRDIFLEQVVELKKELKGIPASKGLVKGRVVCVHGLDQIKKVFDGCVLVINETLVQQEPYLHKCAAMVVQMSGLLSHSAIFAREFKIPTVVGVQDALLHLEDGMEVEVNADKGIVRVLK